MKVTFTGPGAPAPPGRARPGPGRRLTPRLRRARPRLGPAAAPEDSRNRAAPLRPPASAASAASGLPGALPRHGRGAGPQHDCPAGTEPPGRGSTAGPGRSAGLAPAGTSHGAARTNPGPQRGPGPALADPRALSGGLAEPEQQRRVRSTGTGILGTGIPGAAARPALPPQARPGCLPGRCCVSAGRLARGAGCCCSAPCAAGTAAGGMSPARMTMGPPKDSAVRPPAHVVRPRRRYGARHGPTPARRLRLKGAAPAPGPARGHP